MHHVRGERSMRKTLILAALLLSGAAHAESGPVTVAYTPSGDSAGDNRLCEFFQIGSPQWYSVPMTSLGSNAQVLKIENAAQEYLRNPASPNAVVSFSIVGLACGQPRADGIFVGVMH